MNSPVRINLFQRLFRRWETIHPYNGVQAIRVLGEIDADAATRAWSDALTDLGLGSVEIIGKRYRFVPLDKPQQLIDVPGELPDEFFAAQHNQPFNAIPFRPFIGRWSGGVVIGITYQHWIADSVSIRLVLREWFLRLFDPPAARHMPLRIGERGYWKLFGPRLGNWRTIEGTLGVMRRVFRFRRAAKVSAPGWDQPEVGVHTADAPPGLIDAVRLQARACHATVNDVFMAAMVDCCRHFLPFQQREDRRDIAVGAIVDLRKHSAAPLGSVFNMYLGFASVICSPQQMRDWPHLLHAVARQNRAAKAQGVAPASLIWMLLAAGVHKSLPSQSPYHFYRKKMPLAAGISNVNFSGDWPRVYHPQKIHSYLRVSPTGPMTPVALTTTTLGDRLCIAITYRKTVLTDDAAAAMMRAFIQRLESLAPRG